MVCARAGNDETQEDVKQHIYMTLSWFLSSEIYWSIKYTQRIHVDKKNWRQAGDWNT